MAQNEEFHNEIIEGRNSVIEAIKAGRNIDKIYCAKGETDSTLGYIASTARNAGIVVVNCDKRKLDYMSVTKSHQGVIAVCTAISYCDVSDILEYAKERNENPFVIICDEISDPHNLGAIIRTAECAGAHGVIIPKRRNAGVTAIVDKSSAGAAEHMRIAKVSNINNAIKTLKESGLWIYGTAPEGSSDMWSTDMTGPMALVIGSEGSGIGRLVKEHCDYIIKIPMFGQISSLNASVAASIVMYEIVRQKHTNNT